jgi:hypothetical protein
VVRALAARRLFADGLFANRRSQPLVPGGEQRGTQAFWQVFGGGQRHRRGEPGADPRRQGQGPQEPQPLSRRAGEQPREGEGGGEQTDVEAGLGVPHEQQGGGRQGEQDGVPPRAALIDHRDRVEQDRQEDGRAGDRPAEPELEESGQSVGEAPREGDSRGDPLPAEQQPGEGEGQQHPQGGDHAEPGGDGEGEGQRDQRLQRLRLRIREQRLAGAGERVPERPGAGAVGRPHPGQPGGDLQHEVALQQVARRLAADQAGERRDGAEVAERQQRPAAKEDGAEEHGERGAPGEPAAQGDGVVPATEGEGEQQREEGHPEPGEEHAG